MATQWSWITLVVVVICAIHFNSLEAEACCKKCKDYTDDCCCYPDYDSYDSMKKCKKKKYDDDYSCCRKKSKPMKKKKMYDDYDCYDDCCDCSGDYDKKKSKKDGMKEKIMKKIMEKKEKKEKKKVMKKKKKMCKQKCNKYDYDNYDDSCDCCCCEDNLSTNKPCDSCQKIIVENGPAIIQTIIVDDELYAKYGCGCGSLSPLQKVVLKDEDCCYYPPSSCSSCPCDDDCCETQTVRVITKDPCSRSNYCPGYCY